MPVQQTGKPWQSQATQAYQHGDYQQAQQAIQQAIRVSEKADNGDATKPVV
ncbi:hypothetical protein [Nitrincola sp. A-D6]|uniref:hypothetical protein n=1 Tax=Nitrincola sp. A-D6 TaxID=1545442 RepID=UPI000AE89EBB|nr:hypothetical protein [Nitrincola sp. A-D6]